MSGIRKLTKDELAKLQLYGQLMSTQLSRYLAYATLFITVEASGLYLVTSLKAASSTGPVIWIAIGSCIVGAVILFVFCYFSARNMDRWKDRILELSQSTDIEGDFAHWRNWPYHWYQKTGGLIRLAWMAPLFAALVWVWCYTAC